MGLAHDCNNILAFPAGAHQYRIQLPSVSDCVSVILPPYKTSQQVVGSAKLTPDQSRCKGTPDLESELSRAAAP